VARGGVVVPPWLKIMEGTGRGGRRPASAEVDSALRRRSSGTHTPPNSTRCAAARGSPTATLSRSGIGQSRATPANPPSSCDLVVPARPLEAVVDSSPNLRLASSVQGHVAWDPLAAHHSPNHYLTMQRHGQSRVVLTNPSSSCDPVASSTRGRRRLICLA
jgi:hypothetical protein